MKHPSKKLGFGRTVVMLGLLSGSGMAACAQTTSDVTPLSAARSLSCLVRQEKLPVYPSQLQAKRVGGFMRVQLHFSRPDEAPRVDVLVNTAPPELQERAFSYLAGYRLPCLSLADGIVKAVQEFSFNSSDLEPLPMAEERSQPFCVVMPREPIEPPPPWPGDHDVVHVVAVATFSGDGKQAPEVKFIHSTASARFESVVRERLALYRMPCRLGSEPPQAMQQLFSFSPAGVRRYTLKREVFALGEFLGMTADIANVSAAFDFGTMNCPFKVNYTSYGPSLPNEVHAGKRDPNRSTFLTWLSERQLAFQNAKQANELFGETVQIQVPCGKLDLQPAATPS